MTRPPTLAAAAILLAAGAAAAQAPVPDLHLDPTHLVSAPPADGSPAQQAELAQVHRLIAARTPERLAKAEWDDKHEDAGLYAETLGPKFDLAKLPKTAALLAIVDAERKQAEKAKDVFKRKRPWAVDASIKPCDHGDTSGKNPLSSYPSGHSLTGYSLGAALADLIPTKAGDIQARAADYAYSREVCGAHYHSDTEASRVLATALVVKLWDQPSLQPVIADARTELRAAGL